ncbi:MAG TPA: DUF4412 domain-containing protein [Thermoanaerobaculia bacterium]|jgi:hypothetical protein|nr:DUF4412 domain-containing protein [Thermoanaerobaculia bacterium]
MLRRHAAPPAAVLLALPLAALLTGALAARAGADLVITVKGHTDAFKVGDRVQEPRDADVKIWITAEKMRRDEGPLSAIVRLDRKKLYLVNHTDRTYSVVDLPIDWAKLVPSSDREKFQQFVTESQLKSSIKPSAETRKVRTWNTHRVDVELTNAQGLRVSTQMWLTKDLDLYAAYNKMSGVLASLQVSSADWSRKIGDLDGFPVYQETTVSVGGTAFKSHEEVVQAESKQLTDVTFDPPAGFNPVPYDPFRAPQ